MIISLNDFRTKYGSGRPPIAGAFKDVNVNPDLEIPVLTALVDFIKAKRCLEIGVNTGATAAAILAGNNTIDEYIGVDLPAIWFTKEAAGANALHDSRFTLMQLENGSKDLWHEKTIIIFGNSTGKSKPSDSAGYIELVDFVFIDGDHSYPWAGYDSKLAKSLLNPAGGVICWHDYNHPGNPGVKQWIHEENDRNFIANNNEPRIVWVQGTTICYQIIGNAQITAAPDAAHKTGKSDEPKRKKRVKSTKSGSAS